jgi:hypothetical protein
MCTVSFIARKASYALAMNRDEQVTRVAGRPPSTKTTGGRTVLAPSEPGGGTWIALNDGGATLALINWYSITARVKGETVSRGQVVNVTSAATAPNDAEVALAGLPLKRINPFRLIGIFPANHEIVEWRWDLKKLAKRNCPWKAQQWISSGFDEPTAQRIRSQTFRQALQQKSAGRLSWLQRLHRSHAPACGPFSTCMHRADAATVSCTVVAVYAKKVGMIHNSAAPCRCTDMSVQEFRRVD